MRPIARTKIRAIRRANPESRSARDMSIAASTIQTDAFPHPLRARSIGTPPTMTKSVAPIMTIWAPGIGWSIRPAIVAKKMPVTRHPSGSTFSGRGTT